MRAQLVLVALAPALFALPAAAALSCDACRLVQTLAPSEDRERRIIELENRIDALNTEIRGINTNWPVGYTLLAYGGYVVAPSGIFGGGAALVYGLVFLSLGDRTLGTALLVAGGVGLLVGLAAVAAIIYGFTRGKAVADDARARRDSLVEERLRLQRELDREKTRDLGTTSSPPLVQVLTF